MQHSFSVAPTSDVSYIDGTLICYADDHYYQDPYDRMYDDYLYDDYLYDQYMDDW